MPGDGPLVGKAKLTRDKLLATARAVFEADGYEGASISRIVDVAEVSRGTFYLYFESKQHVFSVLTAEIQAAIVDLQDGQWAVGLRPEQAIAHSIRSFVAFYRRHASIMAILEQVAIYDESFRPQRLEMRRAVAERAIRFIVNLQSRGMADPLIDPRTAALALTGMVDRFAFVWFVLGEDVDEATATTTLTRLWYQAIGGTLGGDADAGATP